MTNNKKIIAFLIILGLIIGGVFGFIRYQDYRKFTKASSQLESLVSSIKPLGIKNTSYDKLCTRSHLKYSKGDINCHVSVSFNISDNTNESVIKKVKLFARENDWRYRGENTLESRKLSLYTASGMSCSFNQPNAIDGLYAVDCHGAAKMEYFPVRE